MAANQYLPFGTGTGSNTLSYAAYSTGTPASIRQAGYQSGTADATHINTVLRQVSVAVSALAQFCADYGTVDVVDNGSIATFESAIASAFNALYVRNSDFATKFAAEFGTTFPGAMDGRIAGYFPTSFATPGQVRLASGLIVKWGFIASTGGSYTLPTAFPSSMLAVFASAQGSGGSNADVPYAYPIDSGHFFIGTKGSGGNLSGFPCYWLAIGY